MTLVRRTVPAEWPRYVDPAGHVWRLGSGSYWWLLCGPQWYGAKSPTATEVLGVPVPVFSPDVRMTVPSPAPARVKSAPNIPPEFADYGVDDGADRCTQCRMDDGPIYDGGLCRWCWLLAQLPSGKSAPVIVNSPLREWALQPRRASSQLQVARTVIALVVIWITVAMILRVHGIF
jgi:hypothetical protein